MGAGVMKAIGSLIKNIKLIRSAILFSKVVNRGTYYPEKAGKSYCQKLYDNLLWSVRYREPNLQYHAYGLDIIGADSSNFLDEKTFYRTRNKMNMTSCGKKKKIPNPAILLEDKFVFYVFSKGLGMPTPECFAVHANGELIFLNEYSSETLFQDRCAIFAKKSISGQGKDVFCLETQEQFAKLQTKWTRDKYILQAAVLQHPLLSKINATSVNTMRLVTINDGEEVKPLKAIFKFGTHLSGKVDNMYSGGIGIGINDKGKLMKYGYYVEKYGTKTTHHPDSGVVFEGIKIPFYEEAVEKALQLHKKLYDICSIGWDIAITEEGPVFIEGNVAWGLAGIQICHGGIKKDWLGLYKKRAPQ